MSSRLKENAIEILIDKIHIDPASQGISVDIAINNYDIVVKGIYVTYNIEIMQIDIPINFCVNTLREYPTVEFRNLEDWVYIKKEIEKKLKELKWLQHYFKE